MSTNNISDNDYAPSSWMNSRRKRTLDLFITVPACVVFTPFIVLAALGIKLTSRGSIFFRHPRAGLNGEAFVVLKLRTMRSIGAHESTTSIPDSERLTRFGSFLRRYSLDELPQLFNILRGEMSIVGPRPLPISYGDRYSVTERRRLLARPGLTGLSQVTTRNGGEWSEKLALDAEYVWRASVSLDLRIILGTVRVVIAGTGISAPGHATMPEFKATSPVSDQLPDPRQHHSAHSSSANTNPD